MKVTDISIEEIISADRFEPRYFYTLNKHRELYNNMGFQLLSEIAMLASGTTPEHSDEKTEQENVYFIKSADLKRFAINSQTLSYITKKQQEIQKRSIIKNNDVLISNTGKYLGFSSLFSDFYKEANINQNIIRIRFKENAETNNNPSFLSAFLNSKFGQEEIQSYLTITGQKYLNMQNFRQFKIPNYSKKFIENITEKLKEIYDSDTKAVELINEAKKILLEYLSLKCFENKQSKSFSVNISEFKNEDNWTARFSSPFYVELEKYINVKFQTVILNEIATLQKGCEPGSNKYIQYIDIKKSDIPFIRTTDLVNNECDLFPDFFILKEYANELNQELKAGDILFTKDGKIGQTAMVTHADKAIIASGIARIRVKKNDFGITPEYLFTVLSLKETGYNPAIRRTVIGTTIPHLREERLKQIEIPIIDKETINTITEKVKNAFELKEKRKELICLVLEEFDAEYLKYN